MSKFFSLLGLLLTFLLILVASYFFTRWASKGNLLPFGNPTTKNTSIRVLERVAVGKEQWLLVVQAGTRYFLLGSSSSGVNKLCEFTPEETALWTPSSSNDSQQAAIRFRAMLQQMRNKV